LRVWLVYFKLISFVSSEGGLNLGEFYGILATIWLSGCFPKIIVRDDFKAAGFLSGNKGQSIAHAERQVRLFLENTEVAVSVPAIKHGSLPLADTSKNPR
jgi:hypothetical protein